jgi:SlyX protein
LTESEDTLERVQSKIAYLEQAVAELSDVVFRQHQEIKALNAQVNAVKDRLAGASLDEARTIEQERPPHY